MACEFCAGKFIQQKLGRCKQCMWINFILLLIGVCIYASVDVKELQAVQQTALIMFVGACGILMSSHIVVWCFYWLKNKRAS